VGRRRRAQAPRPPSALWIRLEEDVLARDVGGDRGLPLDATPRLHHAERRVLAQRARDGRARRRTPSHARSRGAASSPSKAATRTRTAPGTHVGDDDHSGTKESDHQLGEALVAHWVNEIANSPYWHDSAIIVTWDDSGGFCDHVPPPAFENVTPGRGEVHARRPARREHAPGRSERRRSLGYDTFPPAMSCKTLGIMPLPISTTPPAGYVPRAVVRRMPPGAEKDD
jgi:Phosphoesterase family